MHYVMSEPVDFDAAARFLQTAREAHEAGNDARFIAARKLVLVALGIDDAPPLLPPSVRERAQPSA